MAKRKYYYDLSVQIWTEDDDSSGYFYSVIQTHSERPGAKHDLLAFGEADTLQEAGQEVREAALLTLE